MAWSRVTCPFCGRSIALIPSCGTMNLHMKAERKWCPGSGETPEGARVAMLDADAVASTIRRGLREGVYEHERVAALAALDDLLALYEKCDEEWRSE